MRRHCMAGEEFCQALGYTLRVLHLEQVRGWHVEILCLWKPRMKQQPDCLNEFEMGAASAYHR